MILGASACSKETSSRPLPGADAYLVNTAKTQGRSAAARSTEKKTVKAKKEAGKAKRSRKAIKRTSEAPSLKELRESLDQAERRLATYHTYFAEGEKDDIYFRLTRDIVMVTRRWRKFANSHIATLGQTMARWETLYLVAFSDEDLSQGGLAQLVGVEGPTMVRMLDSLARDGLIERSQRKSDRRVTVNRITSKGMKVVGEIMMLTNRLRAEVLAGIDPQDLIVCVNVLSRLLLRFDELDQKGRPI